MGILTTRINKGRLWSVCVGILSLGFVSSLIIPSVFSFASASAESVGSSTLSVRVKDVIAIRILDDTGTSSISTLGIDIAPTPNGSTVTKNAIVDVATSNETGYTLYMDSDYKDNDDNDTTSLINTNPTVEVAIPTSISTSTNFWNYKVGSGNATVIPTHGTPDTIRDDVTEPSDSSMTTIGINVNVNNDIPSGTYKNKLVFTAVANELPPALPDFWNITTMQEMTPEICSSVYTPNNTVSMTDEYIIDKSRALAGDYTVTSDNSSPLVPEVTLLDDRDADGTGTKKSYKVRKLADGNCWMVDNLEYDLVGLYNNGKRGIGSKNDGSTFEMTDENLASGVVYYTTTANGYNSVINPNTKPVANTTRTSYLGDITGQIEYYYNWTGATAGQGSTGNAINGVSIDGSICPAGWRLPTNYTDAANQNISWSALTNAYLGFIGDASTTTGYQTLDQYPINLYRAGHVYSGDQSATANGNYWSSTASTPYRGYYLRYNTSLVYPQNNLNNYYGYQVRCVANPKTFWNITTMQEMTPEICKTVYTPTNAVSMTDANIITKERYLAGDYTVTSDNSSPLVPEVTLLDDRDADGTGTKKSYKVRKLADGNCWMVENLEYDLLGLYNNGKRGIGSKNDGSTFEMTDANLATGVAGYYTTPTNVFNYVINANTKPVVNTTRTSYLGDVTGQTEYYYNWTAATAGQGSSSDATDGVSVDGSICPAGWRLPTNYNDTTNQNISWSALTNAYLGITANTNPSTGYQTLEQYPISLYRAGNVYSGNQGNAAYGVYWSSTANSASNGYRLSYYTSYVGPQYNANKYFGYQLRCVASR